MNTIVMKFSGGSNPDWIKLKPPASLSIFRRNFIEQAKVKSGRKYTKAYLILYQKEARKW